MTKDRISSRSSTQTVGISFALGNGSFPCTFSAQVSHAVLRCSGSFIVSVPLHVEGRRPTPTAHIHWVNDLLAWTKNISHLSMRNSNSRNLGCINSLCSCVDENFLPGLFSRTEERRPLYDCSRAFRHLPLQTYRAPVKKKEEA